MADRETKEEVEEYYKHNPSKPRAVKQYNQPAGPEHPHANVKVGSKEQGPTRADLEREQERIKREKEKKFKRDFEIEKGANAARLRGEKRDAKQKATPPAKPHPTFGRAMAEKVWGLTTPPAKPKAAPRKSTRTGPPRLRTRTSAGQLGYFTPARPRKSTRRQPAQPSEFGALSFSGAGFGSLGGGGRTSELNFFTQSKGKKKKGRGSILDFTL